MCEVAIARRLAFSEGCLAHRSSWAVQQSVARMPSAPHGSCARGDGERVESLRPDAVPCDRAERCGTALLTCETCRSRQRLGPMDCAIRSASGWTYPGRRRPGRLSGVAPEQRSGSWAAESSSCVYRCLLDAAMSMQRCGASWMETQSTRCQGRGAPTACVRGKP